MADKRSGTRSIWLRPAPSARQEPPLTRQRITDAAVELLDEEGVERLTMRRLAGRLGVGTTTLYWHVETKDDVIDLATDSVFGEAPLPIVDDTPWREHLVAFLTGWRTTLLRHPWTAALSSRQRPPTGPNFLAWMEFLQATLVRAGLAGDQIAAATWVLFSHVQGSAASQANLRVTDDALNSEYEQLLTRRDLYPTLAEHRFMLDTNWDVNFEWGLSYIIHGIQAQIDAQN